MCSRFEINAPKDQMARLFGARFDGQDYPTGERRPTNACLVFTKDSAGTLSWGIPAPWDGKPLINARLETVAEKPTFRPYLEKPCVVPATAYFEWRKTETGQRLRNRIALAADPLFGFAGLHDGTHFTILTRAPAPTIAHIHTRMPVILAAGDLEPWLTGRMTPGTSGPAPGTLTADEERPPQGDLFG
ncbi:MAG: SOS response-associated peptidase [Magnetospiraceae bacterium]